MAANHPMECTEDIEPLLREASREPKSKFKKRDGQCSDRARNRHGDLPKNGSESPRVRNDTRKELRRYERRSSLGSCRWSTRGGTREVGGRAQVQRVGAVVQQVGKVVPRRTESGRAGRGIRPA